MFVDSLDGLHYVYGVIKKRLALFSRCKSENYLKINLIVGRYRIILQIESFVSKFTVTQIYCARFPILPVRHRRTQILTLIVQHNHDNMIAQS